MTEPSTMSMTYPPVRLIPFPLPGYGYRWLTDYGGVTYEGGLGLDIPHAGIRIITPSGESYDYGFAPASGYEGQPIAPGQIHNDAEHDYDNMGPLIPLSPDEYGRLANFINSSIEAPHDYNIVQGMHCATWARSAMNVMHGLPADYKGGLPTHPEGYMDAVKNFISTFSHAPSIEEALNWIAYTEIEIIEAATRIADSWLSNWDDAIKQLSDLLNHLKTLWQHSEDRCPLVLDLNGDADGDGNVIELAHVRSGDAVYWDIDKDGFAEASAWTKGGDGLLAIDLNGNGAIDDHGELFGSDTVSGFAALGAYDGNADGKITSADAQFGNLRVWVDANQDGYSQASELKTLAQLGITQRLWQHRRYA